MNTRLFLANISMVIVLLLVSSYELCISFAAVSAVDPLHLPDHIIYCAWVFIWVMTLGTGVEVIRDFAKTELDDYLDDVMPLLFPEGVLI